MNLLGVYVPQAVVASLIAALVAVAGTLTVVARDEWARRNRVYFTAFAAGVLLTMGVTLLPEAFEANPSAPIFVLAGYLSLYAINTIFSRRSGAALAPLLAIGLHSYIDGFEYGILFDHDPFTGWVTSAGLIAHEFAEGVILYIFLRAARVSVPVAFVATVIGSALTTPAGAITSVFALGGLEPDVVGMLLAGVAGALIYLGATHLPSHDAQRARQPLSIGVFLVGIILAFSLSVEHGHQLEAQDVPHTLFNETP